MYLISIMARSLLIVQVAIVGSKRAYSIRECLTDDYKTALDATTV